MAITDTLQQITTHHKQNFINTILDQMSESCDNQILQELNTVLNNHISHLTITEKPQKYDLNYEATNKQLIKDFITAKKLKGLTHNSTRYYENQLNKLKEWSIKSFIELTSDDLMEYLTWYKELNNCSNTSLNNIRRILSSFYRWLKVSEIIIINPMERIPSIKVPKRVRKAFTDEEVELLRNELQKYTRNKLRNTAIFELLISSGLRLHEITNLKKSDLNLVECKGLVMGKGKKERVFYFSERAKVSIQSYLSSRDDDKEWLWLAIGNTNKIHDNGVGQMIRELGEKAGVTNVHPHRFRRTLATKLIRKGMALDQVSTILGHASLGVTMMYVENDEELLRLTHKKHTN